MNLFCSLVLVIILNILVALIPVPKVENNSGKCRRSISKSIEKLQNSFKYSVYIRLFFETFQFILLWGLSNINNYDVSSIPKILSLIFSIALSLLCILFVYVSFHMFWVNYNWTHPLARHKWEEYLSGVRPNNPSRLYSFFALIRRLL